MGKTKRSILALALLVFAFGCAQTTITKSTYSVLATSAETYDATMLTLADLYAKGKITEAQKETAIKYGGQFWKAYHTAVDALDAYYNSQAQDAEKKSAVYSALSALSTALGKFLEYSQEITEGGTA
jgi:hypothetical protein